MAGGGTDKLIGSMQFGNVPNNILNDKDDLRKHFRKAFGIESDEIFNKLGDQKHKIKSYMSIGILDGDRNLVAVLSLDSEKENCFAEFETLKNKKENPTILQEDHHLLMMGNHNDMEDQLPQPINSLMQSVQGFIDNLGNRPLEDIKSSTKKVNIVLQALTSRQEKARFGVEGYIFPLSWALERFKEILLKYPSVSTK